MSDEHSSDNNSGDGLSFLGNSLAIIVTLLMILMLAVTGIAFVGSFESEEDPSAASETTSSSSTPTATTPAATGSKTPASGASGIDPAVMAAGQASYALCGACHGMDGKGLKIGPALMAPTLAGSEIVLGDPDKMTLVILKGLKKENADFMGVMAPLQSALDDEKMAAVMTFVRNSFGNSAPLVSVETAKKARERFAKLTDPTGVSRTKLDEVLAAHK